MSLVKYYIIVLNIYIKYGNKISQFERIIFFVKAYHCPNWKFSFEIMQMNTAMHTSCRAPGKLDNLSYLIFCNICCNAIIEVFSIHVI